MSYHPDDHLPEPEEKPEYIISDRLNGRGVYLNEVVVLGIPDIRIIAFDCDDKGRVEIHMVDGIVNMHCNTPEDADKLSDMLVHGVQFMDVEEPRSPIVGKTVKEALDIVRPDFVTESPQSGIDAMDRITESIEKEDQQ